MKSFRIITPRKWPKGGRKEIVRKYMQEESDFWPRAFTWMGKLSYKNALSFSLSKEGGKKRGESVQWLLSYISKFLRFQWVIFFYLESLKCNDRLTYNL